MTPTKDLEGVSDMFESVPPQAASAKAAGGKRQKKIAVLTSGGDSAGMNAAGESLSGSSESEEAELISSPSGRASRYHPRLSNVYHPRRMGRSCTRKHDRAHARPVRRDLSQSPA